MWQRLRQWALRLRRDGLTLWYAARHEDTPRAAKLLALAIAAYAFSPIDLIPDFIPVLGMLDELILLPLAIAACLSMIPPAIVDSCRARADARIAAREGRPRSLAAAVVIAGLWVCAVAAAAWWWWPFAD